MATSSRQTDGQRHGLANYHRITLLAASLPATTLSLYWLPPYQLPPYYLQAEAPERTKDGFEATVGINHLGHFCLASLLQPLLAADGGGRRVATLSLTQTQT